MWISGDSSLNGCFGVLQDRDVTVFWYVMDEAATMGLAAMAVRKQPCADSGVEASGDNHLARICRLYLTRTEGVG